MLGRSLAPCLQADRCSGLLEPTAGAKESLNPRAGVWVFGHHPQGPQGSNSDPSLQEPSQEPRPGCWRPEVLDQGSASPGIPTAAEGKGGLHLAPSTCDPLPYRWPPDTHIGLTVSCAQLGQPLCNRRGFLLFAFWVPSRTFHEDGVPTALRLRDWGRVDTHGALSDHLLSRCLGQPGSMLAQSMGRAGLHVVLIATKAAQSPGTVCPTRAPSSINIPLREAASLAGPEKGPWAGRLHHCPRGASPACGARCWKTIFRCRQEPSRARNMVGQVGPELSMRQTPDQPSCAARTLPASASTSSPSPAWRRTAGRQVTLTLSYHLECRPGSDPRRTLFLRVCHMDPSTDHIPGSKQACGRHSGPAFSSALPARHRTCRGGARAGRGPPLRTLGDGAGVEQSGFSQPECSSQHLRAVG